MTLSPPSPREGAEPGTLQVPNAAREEGANIHTFLSIAADLFLKFKGFMGPVSSNPLSGKTTETTKSPTRLARGCCVGSKQELVAPPGARGRSPAGQQNPHISSAASQAVCLPDTFPCLPVALWRQSSPWPPCVTPTASHRHAALPLSGSCAPPPGAGTACT